MENENDPNNLLFTKKAYYYGTEKSGSWWRRYCKNGWLMRGNAVLWLSPQGLFFRRYLTRRVMHIPTASMTAVVLGGGHAGKWFGADAMKVSWREDGKDLVSGFTLAGGHEEAVKWSAALAGLLRPQP